MKLLLLTCLFGFVVVALGFVDECPPDYYDASKICTKTDDCVVPDICVRGRCCTAAIKQCPDGTSKSALTCPAGRLCPDGYTCYEENCCKIEFCAAGFVRTKATCIDKSWCEATDYCMHGLCCAKDPNPSCPAGFYYSTETCSANSDCGSCGEVCEQGHCCKQAQCNPVDKFTSLLCDKDFPCPHRQYCRAGKCCEALFPGTCPSTTYYVGTTCTTGTDCESPDTCHNGQCCRQAADTCPTGYHKISLTCGATRNCPVGPYECIEGRCCRRVVGSCPPDMFYAGRTCEGDMNCETPDRCISGQCCRQASETCPAFHDKYLNCNHDTPCSEGYICINGACCKRRYCNYMNYRSNQTCAVYNDCNVDGKKGYCNRGLCCTKETQLICTQKNYPPTETCTTDADCSAGTCKFGACCVPASCKATYQWTSKSCDRYRMCKLGQYCHYGRCCEKKDMCGNGKYYTQKTCTTNDHCDGTDTCNTEHQQCCRTIASSCPEGYDRTSRTCYDKPCLPGQTCIDGRCCLDEPVVCREGYFRSDKRCAVSTDCNRWGYCLHEQCCDKELKCPPGYKDPTPDLTCTSSSHCNSHFDACIDHLCCPKVACHFPDQWTDNLCSDGTCAEAGEYCRYGKCCAKST